MGDVDDDYLQRVPPAVPLFQENPPEHPCAIRPVTFRESRDVVREVRDHRRVPVV